MARIYFTWTADKISRLEELHSIGLTFRECAELLKCSSETAGWAYRNYVLGCRVPRHWRENLVGRRFNHFTVLAKTKKRYGVQKRIVWRCRCDCGKVVDVSGDRLRYGIKKSCGCSTMENRTRHGMTKSPTYFSWSNMKQRCTNPKHTGYKSYGGRKEPGPVLVCERWLGKHGFENFLADLGPRPKGLSLERQDPNGNYEPGNCAWANKCQQELNKRRDVKPGEPGYVDPLHIPEPGAFDGEEAF
jgi:hypothetical protein